MKARHTAPVPGPFPIAAIIAIDPAGVGPSGIAIRLTSRLPENPKRGTMPAPDWTFEGIIWNRVMLTELGVFLAKNVGQTGKVVLVAEDSVYGGLHIARHIGTAIGCLRGLLVGLGWLDIEDSVRLVAPATWRRHAFPPPNTPKGRELQKEAAIDLARTLYGYGDDIGSDLAEAVHILDYVATAKPEWYNGGATKEKKPRGKAAVKS